MRTAILTREFPPDVYGGAGVHVDYLVRELRTLIDVDVHAFGADRPGARGHRPAPEMEGANAALSTLSVDLSMAAACGSVDLVHSHTWYANMAGQVSKLLYGVPHVVTAHSLEPRRPWKAEQLGGGYRLSSWAEKTAYEAADAVIAVSDGMRTDILDCYPTLDPAKVNVIRNGIDTSIYRSTDDRSVLTAKGVDLDA
ncbi:MAG: glycosyltransferase, partial [Nakamurella sp.]